MKSLPLCSKFYIDFVFYFEILSFAYWLLLLLSLQFNFTEKFLLLRHHFVVLSYLDICSSLDVKLEDICLIIEKLVPQVICCFCFSLMSVFFQFPVGHIHRQVKTRVSADGRVGATASILEYLTAEVLNY